MSAQISLVTEQQEKGVYVAQFKTNHLAIFTYYIESDKECYLIDPTYDYAVFQEFVQKRQATLKFVVLTHYHADYLAGHTAFKVPVLMGPKSKTGDAKFELVEKKDGETFKIGSVQTKVLHTPGHTLESSCFILSNSDGKEFCVFTGDTVFLREVGRPDLAVAKDITREDLAGMLYDSVQRVKALQPSIRIYPAHGSGSACGKSIGAGNYCDIQTQNEKNYAFLIKDKKEFIETLTKDIANPPKYFFHDASLNKSGEAGQYDEVMKKVHQGRSVQDFSKYIKEGTTVIDTRVNIENGIIKGAYWIPSKAPMCNFIPHVLNPDQQFAIVAEKGEEFDALQRFIRVGYFNILGYNAFNMSEWKGETYAPKIKTIEELDKNTKYERIDVRNKPEWKETGIFEGAHTVPLPQLRKKIEDGEFDLSKIKEQPVVVNCKTGMRARLAASILLKNGVQDVNVLNENIEKIHEKGVKLEEYKE